MTDSKSRRYATRGVAKRTTVSVVLPPHQVTVIRAIANGSNPKRSISSVVSELLDRVIADPNAKPS